MAEGCPHIRRELLLDAQRPCCNRTYHSVLTTSQSALLKQWYHVCSPQQSATLSLSPRHRAAAEAAAAATVPWGAGAARWPPKSGQSLATTDDCGERRSPRGVRVASPNAPACLLAGGGGQTLAGPKRAEAIRTATARPEDQWLGYGHTAAPRSAGDASGQSAAEERGPGSGLRAGTLPDDSSVADSACVGQWVEATKMAMPKTSLRSLPPATAPERSTISCGVFHPHPRAVRGQLRGAKKQPHGSQAAPWASWKVGRIVGPGGWELPGTRPKR
eukprot:TRINITY_DN6765_c0_g1_i1.p1 TRINITY_DN6765_c0_g1~~TRINITY_DN6765_c0_g1_i1.p1  ORF type:complete len:274 (+),score=51.29 TRINITY_DN6765_c0_g1_i1:69-890(+)